MLPLMLRRWLLLAPGLAFVACASQAPTPPQPPTTPSVASVAVSPSPPVDARAVRCGLDDRPRSVVSARPDDDEPLRVFAGDSPSFSLDRALLGKPVAPPPFLADRAAGAPAARARPEPVPMPMRKRPPPQDPPVPPPVEGDIAPPEEPLLPALLLSRGKLSLATGQPLSPMLASRLDTIALPLEICQDLATEGDVGRFEADVDLASSGAALRVTPVGPGQPSRLGRCLMERACQLRSGPEGGGLSIRVPFLVHADQPPPPPLPPPLPQAHLPAVEVEIEGGQSALASEAAQLRDLLAAAAPNCGAGRTFPAKTQARFIIELQSRPAGRRRTPAAAVGQIRTQSLAGSPDTSLLGCVVGSLGGTSVRSASAGRHEVRLKVSWKD
jgi:hypothetical protein